MCLFAVICKGIALPDMTLTLWHLTPDLCSHRLVNVLLKAPGFVPVELTEMVDPIFFYHLEG